jgi:hypothetical protein
LHSKNPLVSYCGQIFSCQWAENIGTEFFFIKNNTRDTVERLQLLPGGVNILGTSSVRLISTPLKAEYKPEKKVGGHNELSLHAKGRSIKAKDLTIDVGPRAPQRRIQQGKFLEDLMRAKEKRGEQDLVTIHAEKRYTNYQWRKEMLRQRRSQRAKLQSALECDDDEARELARKGLEELDEEERRLPLLGDNIPVDESTIGSGKPLRRQQKRKQPDQVIREPSVTTVGEQMDGFSDVTSRTPTPYRQLASWPTASATRLIASRPIAPQSTVPQSSQSLVPEGDAMMLDVNSGPSNNEAGVHGGRDDTTRLGSLDGGVSIDARSPDENSF